MNLIGKILDNRYEILEKIGNGGMATVFKAKCHVLNRFVAIKILKDEFTTDSEFIKRFNSEAQSAASLTHPNIVSIFDVGNEDNLYYIVMELIQGKTLKEIIMEDGKLSWKWSVNIAIQIASALETAHKNNIIHRDIKPHNIIITEEGIAKVTDFGIAKAVSNSTITAFGSTIGSVHYFSPEHARGGYTDAKSDLYSLGVVLYEMLTGRVPFDADTPVSVALKQVQEDPIEPIKYNPEIPVSVNRIILKAMQKDPNLRYQNATEMGRDLSIALKRPNEDFVVLALRNDDSPTQKVPTIYELEMQKNNDRNAPKIDEASQNHKKGKFAKIAEFYSKHKFLKLITILGILGIVFIIAALLAMYGINSSRPKQDYIPQVSFEEQDKMLTEEEATAILDEKGFENYKIEKQYSETVPVGYVISQTPNKYDFLYNLDQEIIIIVSSGPEIVTLPNKIIGEKQDEVTKQLDKLGLKYEITEQTSETAEAGMILSVSPDSGEEVVKSTVINLVVSSGSQFKDVTMISVLGKTEEQAVNELKALNLVVDVKYDENISKPDKTVLAQTVDEGKVIKEQSPVTITVNKLPVKAKVKFVVDVASFKPTQNIGSSTSDNTNLTDDNTTNSSSNSSSNKTENDSVSVSFIIGGYSVETIQVPYTNSNFVWEYDRSSSVEDVRIMIGSTEGYRGPIDFSVEGQVINVKKQ